MGSVAEDMEASREPSTVEGIGDGVEVPPEGETPPAGPVDRNGDPFDIDRHESDGGVPRLSSKGILRIKRGRKTDSKNIPKNREMGKPSPEAKANIDARKVTAFISADMFINTGANIFGPEFLPEKMQCGEHKIDERDMLVSAFDRYYETNGIVDIPPNIALVIALVGYGARRYAKPQSQTKSVIVRVKAWVWVKFQELKGIKNARINSRQNGDGENGSGK